MLVRALKLGYYEHKRRREGDLFNLRKEAEFSSSWMELVDEKDAPEETAADVAADETEAVVEPQRPALSSARKGRKSREVI